MCLPAAARTARRLLLLLGGISILYVGTALSRVAPRTSSSFLSRVSTSTAKSNVRTAGALAANSSNLNNSNPIPDTSHKPEATIMRTIAVSTTPYKYTSLQSFADNPKTPKFVLSNRTALRIAQAEAEVAATPWRPKKTSTDGSHSKKNLHHDDDRSSSYKPLCPRSRILNGTWRPVLPLQPPPYIPTVQHLKCYPNDVYRDPHGYPHNYQWDIMMNDNDKNNNAAADATALAEECEFTTWNRSLFCDIFKFTTVLIVGDSLSWEHYASLAQLLGVHPHQNYQHQSRELRMRIGMAVCPHNRVQLQYRRDDRLTELRATLRQLSPQYAHEYASIEQKSQQQLPQVLILNRGAHYANDTVMMENIRANLQIVEEWLDQCDALGIKCHFFWRTTVPGHPNCNLYTQPISNRSAIEASIGNISYYQENDKLYYHWYDFQHQNELVEAELRSRPRLRTRMIDAYHLNVLRPDEHRAHQGDCLHSCYPGKMDVYSRLLLHYMRMDRTLQDVKDLHSVVSEQGWILNHTTVYDPEGTEAAKQIRMKVKGHHPDEVQ